MPRRADTERAGTVQMPAFGLEILSGSEHGTAVELLRQQGEVASDLPAQRVIGQVAAIQFLWNGSDRAAAIHWRVVGSIATGPDLLGELGQCLAEHHRQ